MISSAFLICVAFSCGIIDGTMVRNSRSSAQLESSNRCSDAGYERVHSRTTSPTPKTKINATAIAVALSITVIISLLAIYLTYFWRRRHPNVFPGIKELEKFQHEFPQRVTPKNYHKLMKLKGEKKKTVIPGKRSRDDGIAVEGMMRGGGQVMYMEQNVPTRHTTTIKNITNSKGKQRQQSTTTTAKLNERKHWKGPYILGPVPIPESSGEGGGGGGGDPFDTHTGHNMEFLSGWPHHIDDGVDPKKSLEITQVEVGESSKGTMTVKSGE